MTYAQTLEYLYTSLPVFQHIGASAYKPGLENTAHFIEHLGNPHTRFRSVHVGGTNGKGSTSHLLAGVLMEAGYRVGLYTSPHLVDFRERIRVNGEMIPQSEVVDFVEFHKGKMEELGLTFFEMTVGLAFDWFARSGVEIAVVEVGLGGRLDSTNIITPLVSIITNIGLDHTALLGDTIAQIAGEKAGIIKAGVPVVVGERDPESAPVFEHRAEQVGTRVLFAQDLYRCVGVQPCDGGQRIDVENLVDGSHRTLAIDLAGDYQRKNILGVVAVVDLLNKGGEVVVSHSDLERGLESAASRTGLQGRWQIVATDPTTICDTGHNEHGLRLVLEQLSHQQYDTLYMVLGFVSDKDLTKILPLLPRTAHYIFTSPSIARALPAADLYAVATDEGLRGEVVPTVGEAYLRARELAGNQDLIFVGGSTFTVADLKVFLDQKLLF